MSGSCSSTTQLVAENTSFFYLDFHNIHPKRVKVCCFFSAAFFFLSVYVARVLFQGSDTKGGCIQKAFSILLKHLALIRLVGWLLNKMFKARKREHQREKKKTKQNIINRALDTLLKGNAPPSSVIL